VKKRKNNGYSKFIILILLLSTLALGQKQTDSFSLIKIHTYGNNTQKYVPRVVKFNSTPALIPHSRTPENIFPNEFNFSPNFSYSAIYCHALSAPHSAESSIKSLASYLVAPVRNERERARAVFRWITENIDYNIEGYFTKSYSNMSPESLLMDRNPSALDTKSYWRFV
jgi:hypothetical protein